MLQVKGLHCQITRKPRDLICINTGFYACQTNFNDKIFNTVGKVWSSRQPSVSATVISTSFSLVTEKSRDSIEEISFPPFSFSLLISPYLNKERTTKYATVSKIDVKDVKFVNGSNGSGNYSCNTPKALQ